MPASQARKGGSATRILIVEDEPTILLLAESVIQDAGYQTLSAGNGTQALALLEKGETFDVLVTDINMGDGPDGIAVANRARSEIENLPVVYASAAALTDGLKAQLVDGGIHLAKPYDAPDLLKAISAAIAAKTS